MPAARRKAPKQDAPQTMEQATDMLARYIGIVNEIERLRLDADTAIATIEAARDAALKPMEEGAKDLFRQLRAWWAVAGDAITEGKRKSAEIAGCLIGVRTTTPALKLPKGMKEVDAVDWLLSLRWAGARALLRIKESLDKPAILKLLGTEAGAILARKGFVASQREEFFIDRAAPKPADPEMVETGEAA